MSAPQTIGLAICAYRGHVDALRRLLDSVAAQTRLPDQVVISCSSTAAADFPYRSEDYPTFPLECIVVEEYQCAAQNRNRAAARLKTDVISFMDADDIMHPQRLEIVLEGFRRFQGACLFLHHTSTAADALSERYAPDQWDYRPNIIYRCPWGSTQLSPPVPPNSIATNGHGSVSRAVLDAGIRFRETPDFYGREDTIFSTDVLEAFPNQSIYCPLTLSQYLPSCTGGYKDHA